MDILTASRCEDKGFSMKDKYDISVAAGDGIGPEVVESAVSVFSAAMDRLGSSDLVSFSKVPVGWESFQLWGKPLTDEVLGKIERSDGLILGPLAVGSYPGSKGQKSPSGAIRTHFDLYANIRPVRTYLRGRLDPIDTLIVRENTQGFYADRNMFLGSGEFMPTRDVALSVRVITREKMAKISDVAFRYAAARRKKVTAVHKGNVLSVTDGLFLEEFRKKAAGYHGILSEDRLVDSVAYDLILHPDKFDVIATTNMYGDILSDEAAAVAGSLGIAPSLNFGDNWAMAQASHGTAPDIAGKGFANPLSEILSVSMLFEWLANRYQDKILMDAHRAVEDSVHSMLESAGSLTPDMGGNAGTADVTASILKNL